MTSLAISIADVEDAALRIAPWAHTTRMLRSDAIDQQVGCTVLFKAENEQVTGAFKFRGACNAIASLDGDALAAGVLTYSSGNHAQAIARAAQLLGTTAIIVMPHDAPEFKRSATQAAGAEIVGYDRYTEDRVAIASELAAEHGRVVIPPFDRAEVMAGQGTAMLEVVDQVKSLGIRELDAAYVCLGGGGLLAGSATVLADRSPPTKVFGVEPEAGDDHRQSRLAGVRIEIPVPETIADGQQTVAPGELTWPINQRLVTDFLAVSDDEIIEAMKLLHKHLGARIEPSGASAFAAVLAGHGTPGSVVAVTLSGGNISAERFETLTA